MVNWPMARDHQAVSISKQKDLPLNFMIADDLSVLKSHGYHVNYLFI